MQVAPHSSASAHAAMILFSALIGSSFTLSAVALPHIGGLTLNAVRFALAATLMLLVTADKGSLRLPKKPWRFVMTGALMALYFTSLVIALKFTTPVATSAVFTLVPLMTTISAMLLVGARSSWSEMASLLLALMGASVIIFHGEISALLGLQIGIGEIIFLGGAVCYAIYTPLLKRFDMGEPPIVQTSWMITAAALWLLLAGAADLVATEWNAIPLSIWLTMLALAIGPTGICFYLIQFASRQLPPTHVSAYIYATPAFVIVQESLLIGHWPALWAWAGAMLISIGLLAIMRNLTSA